MLKIKYYVMAALMGLSLVSASSTAEAGYSAGIGVYSQYLWRGTAQGVGGISVQGDVGYDLGNGISANVWLATGLDDNAEYDFTIEYAGESCEIYYTVGVVDYNYEKNAANLNFREAYVSLSASYFTALVAYDLSAKDSYMELAIDYSLDDMVDLSVIIGLTKYEHNTLIISRDVAVGSMTISPSFTLAKPRGSQQAKDNEFALGVNVSF